jgi:hypothetical protein
MIRIVEKRLQLKLFNGKMAHYYGIVAERHEARLNDFLLESAGG